MGFLSGSVTFTRFCLAEPAPQELWAKVTDKLKQYAFKDIDNVPVERAWGWVNFDDMLDSQWTETPPEKGEYLCFSLRLDTRRIPAAVLKKHFLLAVRAERKEADEADRPRFLTRQRRKELHDSIKQKLMERFLPVPAEFKVIWHTPSGHIYFGSVQEKVLHLFSEFFSLTFDLDPVALTPFALAGHLIGESAATSQLVPTQFV